jgi:hypothetical protein
MTERFVYEPELRAFSHIIALGYQCDINLNLKTRRQINKILEL